MDNSQATLVAAAIAAALSALTLAATVLIERVRLRSARESETTKWLRETLRQAAHDYLQSAFSMSGPSGDGRHLRLAGASDSQVLGQLEQARQAHIVMRDTLTGLRLLGSSSLVVAAEFVYDTHHQLVNFAFHAVGVDEAAYTVVEDKARAARSEFIKQARAPLGLDTRIPGVGAREGSKWTLGSA